MGVAEYTNHHIGVESLSILKSRRPNLAGFLCQSGNSPESVAAVELAGQIVTDFYQLTITCAKDGELAKRKKGDENNLLLLMPKKH